MLYKLVLFSYDFYIEMFIFDREATLSKHVTESIRNIASTKDGRPCSNFLIRYNFKKNAILILPQI